MSFRGGWNLEYKFWYKYSFTDSVILKKGIGQIRSEKGWFTLKNGGKGVVRRGGCMEKF